MGHEQSMGLSWEAAIICIGLCLLLMSVRAAQQEPGLPPLAVSLLPWFVPISFAKSSCSGPGLVLSGLKSAKT